MHESAPIPPDPESERRGHELRDVAMKPVLFFLIGLFLFGGALQAVLSTVMRGYVLGDTKVGVPSISADDTRNGQMKTMRLLRDTGEIDHPPALQRDTTGDMLRMYAEEDAVLTSYKADKKTGQVRVPLDRAMQIVARKGLPHRDTPEAAIDPDAPYPKKSLPYMATP